MTPKQYNEVNETIAEYSRISALLEKAEADIKTRQLKAAEALLPDHAELQMKLGELEEKLRKLATDHEAELFTEAGKRTHATPFGSLKFHRSTSLEVADVEKTLLKIKLSCEQEAVNAATHNQAPSLTLTQFIRTHEELNLEALEAFSDLSLAAWGIKRVTKDNFTVKPFAMKADKPKKEST